MKIATEAITTPSNAPLELLGKSNQSGIPYKYQRGRNESVKSSFIGIVNQRSKLNCTAPKLTKTSESSNKRVLTNL